jgi:hypothetical protein
MKLCNKIKGVGVNERMELRVCASNRCVAYTTKGTKCRRRLREPEAVGHFCCESHVSPNLNDLCTDGCFICNSEDGHIVILECNHAMHEACIRKWFEKNKQCPLCRFKSRRELYKTEPRLEE